MIFLNAYHAAIERPDLLIPAFAGCAALWTVLTIAAWVRLDRQNRKIAREDAKRDAARREAARAWTPPQGRSEIIEFQARAKRLKESHASTADVLAKAKDKTHNDLKQYLEVSKCES